VDFDGDGIPDILSGSWPGQLYLFRGLGKGQFAAGETLKDKNGKEISLESASTVFACDWRDTGTLDLLVGDINGTVWLVPNEGTRTKPAYGPAVRLSAGGKEIRVNHGDSHPVMADWEATGKPGLIVGCGDGGVLFYRNVGTRKEPKLDDPVTLIPGIQFGGGDQGQENPKPKQGNRAKVCVFDWNGDGKVDLLVGDFSSHVGKAPKLTEAEKKKHKELQEQMAAFQKEMKPYFDEINRISKESAKINDPKERKEFTNTKYQEAFKRFETILNKQRDLYQAMSKYQAPHQTHGYVWLYQRLASSKTELDRNR